MFRIRKIAIALTALLAIGLLLPQEAVVHSNLASILAATPAQAQ